MIYTVHFFDACDSINTRITTHHADLGAAQAQSACSLSMFTSSLKTMMSP